jgi:acetyl-CoA carboxylase carboxyltransferase component
MKQTAVEWFFRWILDNEEATIQEGNKAYEQAKEMEKEQSQKYAEFAIHCDRNNLPILKFEDFIKL